MVHLQSIKHTGVNLPVKEHDYFSLNSKLYCRTDLYFHLCPAGASELPVTRFPFIPETNWFIENMLEVFFRPQNLLGSSQSLLELLYADVKKK